MVSTIAEDKYYSFSSPDIERELEPLFRMEIQLRLEEKFTR